MTGPTSDQCYRLAAQMGFEENLLPGVVHQIQNLYKLFIDVDATQVEINPFGETDTGRSIYFISLLTLFSCLF